jgi:hypothetical protein
MSTISSGDTNELLNEEDELEAKDPLELPEK